MIITKLLRYIVFGKPNSGENIIDKNITFRTTIPSSYSNTCNGINSWFYHIYANRA